jgi:hypothetical protein
MIKEENKQLIIEQIYKLINNQEEDEPFKDNKNKQTKEKKLNAADILINKLSDKKLFFDGLGGNYMLVNVNDHDEIMDLDSDRFKLWLTREARNILDKAASISCIKQVTDNMAAKAQYEGTRIKLDVRVFGENKTIYYDLCNNNYQVLKIDETGWSIIDNPPIVFKRYGHQAPQVIPDNNGDINRIFDLINVKEEDKLLFLVYLISCFIPGIPHTVGIFYGEKGAAKTTTLKILKMIIDPSILDIMTFPKNNADLIQVLSHHWFCNFDNISYIDSVTSDTLCRAATGEGFTKRGVFTNDDDIIYSYKRCVAINGINLVAKKEDLLDRSILFELERISEHDRKEETKIWEKFNIIRPTVLGAIFTILSKAMKKYETTQVDLLYRMGDFTKWGYVITEALGYDGSVFMKKYKKCIDKQNQEVIQSNPFAATVTEFMKEKGFWKATPHELLKQFQKTAEMMGLDLNSPDFPKTYFSVTKKLNQIRSNLLGIGISFNKGHKHIGNIIELYNDNPIAINNTEEIAINTLSNNYEWY